MLGGTIGHFIEGVSSNGLSVRDDARAIIEGGTIIGGNDYAVDAYYWLTYGQDSVFYEGHEQVVISGDCILDGGIDLSGYSLCGMYGGEIKNTGDRGAVRLMDDSCFDMFERKYRNEG